MRRLVRVAACCLVLLLPAAANAGIIQYFGEDLGPRSAVTPRPASDAARVAFLASLIGVSTEDFESFSDGQAAPLALSFGPDTATLTGGSTINEFYPASPAGRIPTSGTKYFTANNTFKVSFDTPQAAFGFYGSDIGDFAGQLSMTVNFAAGGSQVIIVPHTVESPSASLLYFGIIGTTAADTFTSIQFGTTTGDDIFGFDDMTIGRLDQVAPPVPEPGTLLLLGSALTLGARRLRKRG